MPEIYKEQLLTEAGYGSKTLTEAGTPFKVSVNPMAGRRERPEVELWKERGRSHCLRSCTGLQLEEQGDLSRNTLEIIRIKEDTNLTRQEYALACMKYNIDGWGRFPKSF